MRIEVKKDGVDLHFNNKNYSLNLDELREFEIEIEYVPKKGIHSAHYWIYSTSSDPIYKEMSALVFCDLQDALNKKINRINRKVIAR